MSVIKKLFGKDEPASVTEQIQQLYMGMLKEFSDELDITTIELDGDGDVRFSIEEFGTLWLHVDERDPEYFHMMLPNFLDHNQAQQDFGADLPTLFRACNQVRTSCKAANVFLLWNSSDSTWNACSSIECMLAASDALPSKDLIKATFKRNLSAIATSARQLIVELRGDDDESSDD